MTRMVHCVKLGKEAEGMKFPPLPNELGKRIFENVSQEAWNAWTRHQTMLINENRLSLADPRAREYLAQQMEQYFFGDGADAVQGYVPQEPKYRHHLLKRSSENENRISDDLFVSINLLQSRFIL